MAVLQLYCERNRLSAGRSALKRLRKSLSQSSNNVSVCFRCSSGLEGIEDAVRSCVGRSAWPNVSEIAAFASSGSEDLFNDGMSGGGLRLSVLVPKLLENATADKYGVIPAVLPLLWSPNEVLFEEVGGCYLD